LAPYGRSLGFSDGLNVFVGDNEAAKSTSMAALRTAIFEKRRVGGEIAQAIMLPYNQPVRLVRLGAPVHNRVA